jgi:hypothetical protein
MCTRAALYSKVVTTDHNKVFVAPYMCILRSAGARKLQDYLRQPVQLSSSSSSSGGQQQQVWRNNVQTKGQQRSRLDTIRQQQ